MRSTFFLLALGLTAFWNAGCGKPPSAGGPPSEFSVNAVVAAAQPETVRSMIQVVGSLRARDAVSVVSEINGTVEEIFFQEGQPVSAGQVLVRLDDVKLKARVNEAAARHRLAASNLERSRNLLQSQTISEQEFDQVNAEFAVADAVLKLLERELQDTVITAPFDGLAGERLVSPGQFLTVGTPMTRVVRMNPLEAEFRVPEGIVGQVQTGQIVMLKVRTEPGMNLEGTIFFVEPSLDENSRTALVKASIPNDDFRLKPGMFGNLDVILEERENALVIPEQAVRQRGDQAYVVLVNGENRAEFRDVTVGERMPGKVEITSGLMAGDRVVIQGYQKMGPGTQVIIAAASEPYGVTPDPAP